MSVFKIGLAVIFIVGFCEAEMSSGNEDKEDKTQTKRSIHQTFLLNPKFKRVFHRRPSENSLFDIFFQNTYNYDTLPIQSKYMQIESPKIHENLKVLNRNDKKLDTINEVNQTEELGEHDFDDEVKIIYDGVDENQNVSEKPIAEENNVKISEFSEYNESTDEVIPIFTKGIPLLTDLRRKNFLGNDVFTTDISRNSEETTVITEATPKEDKSTKTITSESTLQLSNLEKNLMESSEKSTLKLDNAAKERLFMILNKRLLKSLEPVHNSRRDFDSTNTIYKKENNNYKEKSAKKSASAAREISVFDKKLSRLFMRALGTTNKYNPYNTITGFSLKEKEVNSGLLNIFKMWQRRAQTHGNFHNNSSDFTSAGDKSNTSLKIAGLRLEETLNRKIQEKSNSVR